MNWLKKWFTHMFSCGYVEYDPEAGVIARGSEILGDYYISWLRFDNRTQFEAHSIASGERTIKMTFRHNQALHNAPTGSGPLVKIITRFIQIFKQLENT